MSGSAPARRLTAILATDVVGYSRLMSVDEEGTLERLMRHRSVIEGLIVKHGGKRFGSAGDSLMVEFGSAVEAVRCAVSIQEELAVRNAELPDVERMLFRIGINVGDVMVEDDTLYGDGVNIAARLEGLADPGGICISASTFEQVKNRVSIGFEDIGPKWVKNIPNPVSVFRVVQAPVSVQAKQASAGAGSGVRTARRVKPGGTAAVAAALLAVALVGAAAWYLFAGKSTTSDLFMANFSTDNMPAANIRATLVGTTIQGISNVSKQPFTITLNANGVAALVLKRSGKLEGTFHRENGKWWARDYSFCMQFDRFAAGRRICPRINRQGDKVWATTGFGRALGWAIYKK